MGNTAQYAFGQVFGELRWQGFPDVGKNRWGLFQNFFNHDFNYELIRRIPMALGPVIGGALVGVFGETQGVRVAFIVALVLAGVSLILQQRMITDEKRTPVEKTSSKSYGLTLLNAPLRNLLVSDILVRFCEQNPYAFIVIWCVSINNITPLQFGLLRLSK